MQRGHLDDLLAFLAVAREQSFTKAAAKLGVSQSALSHTMRALEARLDVRLLTRTTRRVAPTAAGERLLHALGPRFEEIEAELAAISDRREKPAGTIRITATEYAADAFLLPKLLRDYSDIKVEIAVDYGLTDIVTQRYDAGVRSGEQVAKDMIAVRVGPDTLRELIASVIVHPAGKDEPRIEVTGRLAKLTGAPELFPQQIRCSTAVAGARYIRQKRASDGEFVFAA
jgi:DNA-binding transcriptional LysR family regulator